MFGPNRFKIVLKLFDLDILTSHVVLIGKEPILAKAENPCFGFQAELWTITDTLNWLITHLSSCYQTTLMIKSIVILNFDINTDID